MENLIISTLGQGLLWSLLAIGVFITFRVLDIADLTVEGSFRHFRYADCSRRESDCINLSGCRGRHARRCGYRLGTY